MSTTPMASDDYNSDSDEYDFPPLPTDDAFLDELANIERAHFHPPLSSTPNKPSSALLPPSTNSQKSISSPSSSLGVRHVDVELEVELAIDRSLDARAGGESSLMDGDSVFLSSLGEDEIEEAIARQLQSQDDMEDLMPPHPSLFALYRRRNFFSVTDLAAPTWCEVQYDYGLRGKRFLKPSDRPTTFITSKGNVIAPDLEKAVANDKTMKKGTKIHKALEREIHPVEIKVTVETKEETWALRILNMLASLEALMALGKCREMPVMGFIKGHLVVGIIDEIQRVPLVDLSLPSSSTPTSSPKKSTASPQTNKITSYFIPSSPAKGKGRAGTNSTPTHTLKVSDSKTRKTRSLPREDASLSGKIQTQAYKFLLDALLRPPSDFSSPNKPSFSFPHLFASLDLSSQLQLSEEFLAQAQILIDGNGLDCPSIATLDDLADAWERTVSRLGVDRNEACSRDLELVYRFQETTRGRSSGKRKVLDASMTMGSGGIALSVEENDRLLALAIQASLGLGIGAEEVKLGGVEESAEETDEEMLERAIAESLKGVAVLEAEGSTRLEVLEEEKEGIDDAEELPPDVEPQHRNPWTIEPGSSDSLARATSSQLSISSPKEDSSSSFVSQLRTSIPILSQSASSFSKPIEISDSENSDSEEEESNKPVASSSSSTIPATSLPFDETSLLQLKHPELKTLAFKHSLPTWGRKVDLIARLLKSSSSASSSTPASSSKRPRRSQSKSPTSSSDTSLSTTTSSSSYSDPSPLDASIIGVVSFQYSHQGILAHFDDILSFWLGERAPRGVSMENTMRCEWCEFKEGCEWREQEGQRIWEEGRRRKAGLEG
ncbi:exonuclease V [Mrakia frigida]|uniref:exonuclease V n=1 Tax=Mrakia frigida TaxID=29902 RepID=UPI003FCBEEAF